MPFNYVTYIHPDVLGARSPGLGGSVSLSNGAV